MTKRRVVSLWHSGTAPGRWARTAINAIEGGLSSLCFGQWRQAALAAAPAATVALTLGPTSRPDSRNALREGLDWSVSCEPRSSFDCGYPQSAQTLDISRWASAPSLDC
jgi:hypothetical protein